MTDATSTEPERRVCPDCSNPAGNRPFTDSCGRNLATVERLRTRREWEAGEAVSAAAADETRSANDEHTGAKDSPDAAAATAATTSPSTRTAGQWIRKHRVSAAIGAGGIAAAIIVIVIIASSSGGGAADPVAAENSVALYVAGASNLNPGDATCKFTSTLGRGIFQCSTTVEGVEFQTMDATYDSDGDINTDSSAVTISNYQTVNVPPGYTYDPSTGHYAPGPGVATP